MSTANTYNDFVYHLSNVTAVPLPSIAQCDERWMDSEGDRDFSELKGLVFKAIAYDKDREVLYFITDTGRYFALEHDQDCCEKVWLESVTGDLLDLLGTPILLAEESTNSGLPPPEDEFCDDSHTWTFYKLATKNGYVDLRWFGTSNGCYAEDVVLREITTPTEGLAV